MLTGLRSYYFLQILKDEDGLGRVAVPLPMLCTFLLDWNVILKSADIKLNQIATISTAISTRRNANRCFVGLSDFGECSRRTMVWPFALCAQWTSWTSWCSLTHWLPTSEPPIYAALKLERWISSINTSFLCVWNCAEANRLQSFSQNPAWWFTPLHLVWGVYPSHILLRICIRQEQPQACFSPKRLLQVHQVPLWWTSRLPPGTRERAPPNVLLFLNTKNSANKINLLLYFIQVLCIYAFIRLWDKEHVGEWETKAQAHWSCL